VRQDLHREQMMKNKRLPLQVFACLTLLVLGFALVAFLPSPEERAFNELLQVEIESIRWNGITPREAVAEVNAEIQKVSDTRYRLILSEDARSDIRWYWNSITRVQWVALNISLKKAGIAIISPHMAT
jgi:hypothetical protein